MRNCFKFFKDLWDKDNKELRTPDTFEECFDAVPQFWTAIVKSDYELKYEDQWALALCVYRYRAALELKAHAKNLTKGNESTNN